MIGGQTVTVRNFTADGRDRFNAPVLTAVDTTVSGVSMQPKSVSEAVTLTDIASELWTCYVPPDVEISTTSHILYDAMTFEVLGCLPGVDFAGRTTHIAVELKRQLA